MTKPLHIGVIGPGLVGQATSDYARCIEFKHRWQFERAFGVVNDTAHHVPIPGMPFWVDWPQPAGFPKRGLTGVVFTGVDDSGKEIVAKFFDPHDLDPASADWKYLRSQFLSEANKSQGIGGDCVVRTLRYDKGLDDPWRPVIVMERADVSVYDLITECQDRYLHLSLKVALKIAWGTARGIKKFHESSLVHRDVKPHNMVVIMASGYRFVGVAQLDHQRFEAKIGDPGFASPMFESQKRWFKQDGFKADEQLREGVSDPRSDVFGFGKTLERLMAVCYVNPGEESVLLERLAVLANQCTQTVLRRRPAAKEVVETISGIVSDFKRMCSRR